MAERKADQSALPVNQAFIIMMLVVAFIFDALWLVALVGVPGFTRSPRA